MYPNLCEALIMEKYCLFILCMLVSCMLLSGCDIKQQTNSPIKYQRRLEKYLPSENKNEAKMIDLSEGPKTKYDARFGPNDLNFDVKINTRY